MQLPANEYMFTHLLSPLCLYRSQLCLHSCLSQVLFFLLLRLYIATRAGVGTVFRWLIRCLPTALSAHWSTSGLYDTCLIASVNINQYLKHSTKDKLKEEYHYMYLFTHYYSQTRTKLYLGQTNFGPLCRYFGRWSLTRLFLYHRQPSILAPLT